MNTNLSKKYKISIDFKINIEYALHNLQVQVVGFHILICCLNLSKEFRFLYRFGTVFHIILPLKHSASVPYCEVFVLGNLSCFKDYKE